MKEIAVIESSLSVVNILGFGQFKSKITLYTGKIELRSNNTYINIYLDEIDNVKVTEGKPSGFFAAEVPSLLKIKLKQTNSIRNQVNQLLEKVKLPNTREKVIKQADLATLGLFNFPTNEYNFENCSIFSDEGLPISFRHKQYNNLTIFKTEIIEAKKNWIIRSKEKTVEERNKNIENAKEKERLLDYNTAIQIWEDIGEYEEAARVRKLKVEQSAMKVHQTVVHGDYVDDRDTIVKDSVINRSNIGGGSSKMQELKDLTEMKEKGLIDDDEFKQMKKEILGK
tara:strand:- start:405 stop:1253 length:849 start_codon:yes stop_codon:yes gene_type:complete